MKEKIPLFFGKSLDKAILTPTEFINFKKRLYKIKRAEFPKYCLLSFFRELDKTIKKRYKVEIHNWLNPETGYPIYIFNHRGTEIAYNVPGFGAPYAASALEKLIALGMEYFIFIGGVGIIQEDIKRNEIVIPTKAIRDEGTSYHYARSSKYAYPSKLMLKVITDLLKKKNISFHSGPTWTIDAPYRETIRKIRKYQSEGCLSVEMEASALFAIANYRKKHIGGIFLAGDLVTKNRWEPRLEEKDLSKRKIQRRKLLDIALEIFQELKRQG